MVIAAPPRPTEPDAAAGPDDERAIVEQAVVLRQAFADGRSLPLLRGRNLGLLCPDAGTPEAKLFREAAAALGAHVAHISADAFDGDTQRDLAGTARMLGRLYDAVECQGLAPGVAQHLQALSGSVVCDGLAADADAIDRLVRQLGGSIERCDDRRFVLQALLLRRLT